MNISRILWVVFLMTTFMLAKDYRGAEYRTKAAYTYGRFEVRMKSAQLAGMLSSFFTYHEISNLNEWNELDIEILGRFDNQAQFNAITPGQTNHVFTDILDYNPHASFHVYAMEWTPAYVAWYVDSIEVYRQTADHIQTLTRDQKIMMNIWPPTNTDWTGVLDDSQLPVFAYYDWVAYYAYTPGENDNFTLQWKDDFDNYDSARWTRATHTWDGNNSDFITDNVAFQDGYMILCLTKTDNTGYDGSPVVDEDTVAPYIQWIRFFGDEVHIWFSEAVDKSSAEQIANYTTSGLTIDRVASGESPREVILTVSGRDPGKSYRMTIANIKDTAPVSNVMPSELRKIANDLQFPFVINVGSDDGVWTYKDDFGFSGGEVMTQPESLEIGNTDTPEIYRSEVRNILFYNAWLANGMYKVTLMFAETEFDQSGRRVFDVYAENQLVAQDVDIYSQAGKNTAYNLKLPQIEIKDQKLDLYFKSKTDGPVLSGMKIEQVVSGLGEKKTLIPKNADLLIYPNPFNPSTRINFTIDHPAMVLLDIFDNTGRRVEKFDEGYISTGKYKKTFDGQSLSSGVYYCVLRLNGHVEQTCKMVLIK